MTARMATFVVALSLLAAGIAVVAFAYVEKVWAW